MNAKANQVWDFHKTPNHRLDEPNISFSQSPPCHIPSMNVGIKARNQPGLPEAIAPCPH